MGPPGSGKTTLVETLLVCAGVLNRAGTTAEGTTVSDFDESEQRQQRSVGRTVVRAEVPQVELSRYAVDLRVTSHGAASLTRGFARFEPVPDNIVGRPRT